MNLLSLALLSLLLRLSHTLDCSVAPPFRGLTTIPKGNGHRIGRKVSILFTPPSNTSIIKVRFGMRADESDLLFRVKLQKPKAEYFPSEKQSLSVFVQRLVVHQKCMRPFIELVIIPHCDYSKKIFFVQNSDSEFVQYEVISYDIMNPIVSKFGKALVLSTEIIECRAMDLNARGYFISHSFPVFFFPNSSVRVPAHVVSRINKTRAIYVITYRISNATILNNDKTPLNIIIAREASQKAHGIYMELFPVAHTLGITWLPSIQVQRNGNLLRFRYTFLRNESRSLTTLEVHLGYHLAWRAGQHSLLIRVSLLPHDATHVWRGFRLPITHSAFHALHHMTCSTEGDFQTLEIGLVPDDSCLMPMVFHVLALRAKGRPQLQASGYFESVSLRSFDLWRRHLQQEGHVRAEVDFCSPHLNDRAPPKVQWRLEGLYTNWTALATQSKKLDESSLRLNLTFPILLRCEVQNLSLAIADSEPFQVVLNETLAEEFCKAHVRWSVVTTAGRQFEDLTWIRKQEPFFLRLDAHFPHFFSAEALMEVEMPQQQKLIIQRSLFKPDGEVLRLRQQWRQQMHDCRLFAETFQARILDVGMPMALAKMAILPQFCRPRIIEFKALSESTRGSQLAVSCRIETAAPLHNTSWGILDNYKLAEPLDMKTNGTAIIIGATINFSSCENLHLRAVLCWFRHRDVQIAFRPLFLQDALCEGPMLYSLFLIYGVLPLLGLLYFIVALRVCLLERKQRI